MDFSIWLLTFAIIFNALANMFFKYSALYKGDGNWKIWLLFIGFAFGGLNGILYTQAIKKINLNVAYSVFSVGSILIIFAISYFLFSETLTVKKIFGMVAVCVGIGLITL